MHWQRGTMAELSARIKGTSPRPPNAVASLCLIFAEAGRDDEAAALLDRGADAGFADLPRDPAYITVRSRISRRPPSGCVTSRRRPPSTTCSSRSPTRWASTA